MSTIWQKLTGLSEEELGLGGEAIEIREEREKKEEKKIEPKEEVKEVPPKPDKPQEKWLEEEGQLSVDVYQKPDNVVIRSTMAGVRPEDIDIAINNDMVTIRGERVCEEKVSSENYFHQECFWGRFSRSIILPVEVDTKNAQANLKNGVLTITLPKLRKKSKRVKIKRDKAL
jgi:HSP20 family protein